MADSPCGCQELNVIDFTRARVRAHTHTVSQVPYHVLNTTRGGLCHPPAAATGAHCHSTLELRDRGPTEVRSLPEATCGSVAELGWVDCPPLSRCPA